LKPNMQQAKCKRPRSGSIRYLDTHYIHIRPFLITRHRFPYHISMIWMIVIPHNDLNFQRPTPESSRQQRLY
jgi:hypothetical protein